MQLSSGGIIQQNRKLNGKYIQKSENLEALTEYSWRQRNHANNRRYFLHPVHHTPNIAMGYQFA
jgi:hypothetical protein